MGLFLPILDGRVDDQKQITFKALRTKHVERNMIPDSGCYVAKDLACKTFCKNTEELEEIL